MRPVGAFVIAVLVAWVAWLAPNPAVATGFTDLGYDVLSSRQTRVAFDGSLRLRSAWLRNLDLDRGETPSGELLFPVSLSEPDRQSLFSADLRLRTDLAFYAPGGFVATKMRLDVLGNMPIGGSADGIPGGSFTQDPPDAAFLVRRAWGEVVTPLGYLAAGRMGSHWGLGMLANGGDCPECDSGDAADRIVFATAAIDHIWAVAYDFSASGHLIDLPDEQRTIDVEPSAAVRTLSGGLLHWHSDAALRRRLRAGKTTFEYGLYYAHRWQDRDIPASYLPVAQPVDVGPAQVVQRDLRAHVVDVWLRLSHPSLRVEAEAAYVAASVGASSSIPGFEIPGEVESDQFGAVLESEVGPFEGAWGVGVDLGYASGDPAPGFGARPPLQDLTPPEPGDLDGPQALLPGDRRVDNFRFHPDYRVDRILFREIVGTVTDAVYVRPHARLRLLDFGSARLDASLVGIASWANEAASAPGLERPLGIELDPTLEYHDDDGFAARLEHAVLFPLGGLDNPELGASAEPAQVVRVHLAYGW